MFIRKLATRNLHSQPAPTMRRVIIKNLILSGLIGVYEFEKEAEQKIRINLELLVPETNAQIGDKIENVVCYDQVAQGVRKIVKAGHIHLVETMAENIAHFCLQDPRIYSVKVRVEKLDIMEDSESVGVEIERFSTIG